MAEIGVTELYTQANGWVEVKLYSEGTFDFEPVEFPAVSGQAGYPYLTNPSNADTPIEVYTSTHGWMGINSLGILPIDDFEHNDLDTYYRIADTRSTPEIRSSAARSGNYGWYGSGDTRTISLPPGHPNYNSTYQADFLPNYPSSGDIFECYMYVVSTSSSGNGVNRIHWGAQDYEEGNPTGGYRLFMALDENYWRIEYLSSSGSSTLQGDGSLPFTVWPRGEWLRFVIDWRGTGFTVYGYRQDGTQFGSLTTTHDTITSGGVGYDNGQYATSYTDDWNIIPELP